MSCRIWLKGEKGRTKQRKLQINKDWTYYSTNVLRSSYCKSLEFVFKKVWSWENKSIYGSQEVMGSLNTYKHYETYIQSKRERLSQNTKFAKNEEKNMCFTAIAGRISLIAIDFEIVSAFQEISSFFENIVCLSQRY